MCSAKHIVSRACWILLFVTHDFAETNSWIGPTPAAQVNPVEAQYIVVALLARDFRASYSPRTYPPYSAIRPGLPCPAGKQAHGHPAGAPAVSVKTAAPDSGRTGPGGSQCCCCGSCGRSCYGWRHAGSLSRAWPLSASGLHGDAPYRVPVGA